MTATAPHPDFRSEAHGQPPPADPRPRHVSALQPTLRMTGVLDRCVLLNFRTPAESVESLLPPGLELFRRGPYAFWNVVLCHVHKMRPLGVPEGLGMSYHHVAYRLRVQAMTDRADTRQGLYFVRSDADAAVLGAVGNRLSDFKFHRAQIDWRADAEERRDGTSGATESLTVTAADGRADARLTFRRQPPVVHPADSCFPTAADARAALKYEPLGLAINRRDRLKLAEVFRDETQWCEDAIDVAHAKLGFFDTLGQTEARLELATWVAPLPYRWRLGRRESLMIRPRPAPTATPGARPLPRPAVA
ncbi:MAG: DUF2071 domain-containing protein [Planctomycetota bacterium]